MEDLFAGISDSLKKKIVDSWRSMSETDKTHFINQISLGLSVWGSDLEGKKLVVDVLKNTVEDGSTNLSDFGLYLKNSHSNADKIKRAGRIIEDYRMKNSLTSEPHKDILA